MKSHTQNHNAATRTLVVRNPFGVLDVPDPDDREVMDFAARTQLNGGADSVNAPLWETLDGEHDSIAGRWSSRWNGGADPTIPGDSPAKWKRGRGELRMISDRAYILFNWDNGARKGLIEARREPGNRLVGKYINLGNTEIMRPWVGLIVNNGRIDGQFSHGRLDFRR